MSQSIAKTRKPHNVTEEQFLFLVGGKKKKKKGKQLQQHLFIAELKKWISIKNKLST